MDNMLRICVPLLLLCFAHLASSEQSSQDSPFSTGVRVLLNSYSACRNDREPINCLKFKFLRLADRMLNSSSVSIIDGVNLIAKPGMARSLSFNQEEKPLFDPSLDEDARESEIDSLIWHRLRAIIKSKSIQLNMPKMLEKTKQLIGLGEEEEEEGTVADGRGKKEKKKKSFILLAAMMVKGTMIALLFKALALLAGKALVVSKIALTLSVLIAIKKLFSAPPPEKTTYEIVKTPIVTHSHEYSHSGYSGGDEGYGRSLEKEELEKRQILAKGIYPPVTPPRYRYEKYEPVPEITSKVPFFYINEAEVADTDTVDGFERDFQSNLNNNDIDGSALENKWSPKLSETVEPIRNTNNNNRKMYNPYGYRSSRVMKQPVVKTESQPIKTVEPLAKTTESPKPSEARKGVYNSFRSSRVMKAVSSENVLPEGTASKVDIVTPSAGSETRKETSQKK